MSALPFTEPTFDIVGELLKEQQSLTAVQRFSALHESGDLHESPTQEKYYRNLLPASPPAPGQQFAFEVDLDKCSGCKACVVACHTLNGLEEDESWRRVGTITIGESSPANELPTVQHVTTACHHCEDPGCLNGCPVKAYEKDEVTGIVRHLDDQCIGCKYCTMMCPYEVPKYSDRLGIVRKCDMCHQRLSVGEAPACVQACPNEAIAITVVDQTQAALADSRPATSDSRLAPGAPSSSITKPTTKYVTTKSDQVAHGVPQDVGVDEVAESHWPLAVMLVATQASVGIILFERLLSTGWLLFGGESSAEFSGASSDAVTRVAALVALIVGGIGLNLAPLHLGQPLRAWRVFLGLRTSWLSREAIILGKYMGLLGLAVTLLWLPALTDYLPESVSQFAADWIPTWAGKAALGLSIPVGIAGLYSSAMIYVATKRRLWRHSRTFARFGGTAVIAGIGMVAAVTAWYGFGLSTFMLGLVVAALLAAKIAYENKIHLGGTSTDTFDVRSHRLVETHLSNWKNVRYRTAIAGGLAVLFGAALALVMPGIATAIIMIGALAITAGELAERLLYFSSVVYDRMPGTL